MNGLDHNSSIRLSVNDFEFKAVLSTGCHVVSAILQSDVAEKIGITRFKKYHHPLAVEGRDSIGPMYTVPINVIGLDDSFQVPILVSDILGFSVVSAEIFLQKFSLRFDPPGADVTGDGAAVTFLPKTEGKIKYPPAELIASDTSLFQNFPGLNVSFALPSDSSDTAQVDKKIEAGAFFLDTSFSPYAAIQLLADTDIPLDQYWEQYPKQLYQTKHLYSPLRLIPTTLSGGGGEQIATLVMPVSVAERGRGIDTNLISAEWLLQEGHSFTLHEKSMDWHF
jgi:hypothetical protein